MTPLHTCPECTGVRHRDHPAGLVFDHHQACTLLAREDVTKAADAENVPAGWDVRPITGTEVALLTACGVNPTAVPDRTIVTRLTRGVIRRSWLHAGTGEPLDLDTIDPPDEPTTEDP